MENFGQNHIWTFECAVTIMHIDTQLIFIRGSFERFDEVGLFGFFGRKIERHAVIDNERKVGGREQDQHVLSYS